MRKREKQRLRFTEGGKHQQLFMMDPISEKLYTCNSIKPNTSLPLRCMYSLLFVLSPTYEVYLLYSWFFSFK